MPIGPADSKDGKPEAKSVSEKPAAAPAGVKASPFDGAGPIGILEATDKEYAVSGWLMITGGWFPGSCWTRIVNDCVAVPPWPSATVSETFCGPSCWEVGVQETSPVSGIDLQAVRAGRDRERERIAVRVDGRRLVGVGRVHVGIDHRHRGEVPAGGWGAGS